MSGHAHGNQFPPEGIERKLLTMSSISAECTSTTPLLCYTNGENVCLRQSSIKAENATRYESGCFQTFSSAGIDLLGNLFKRYCDGLPATFAIDQ